MPQQSFFANLFQGSMEPLDVLARKLKNALSRALLNFQMASEIEFATKVPPQLFNTIDTYIFERKGVLSLNPYKEEIEASKDRQGMFAAAQRLLDSNDPVMRFCVAVELSEIVLDKPSPITLENKSLNQLRELAQQDGGQLVQAVRDRVIQQLEFSAKLKKS